MFSLTSKMNHMLTLDIGLHRLLYPRRGSLPTKRIQSQEPEDQRLPRKSKVNRRLREKQHSHGT